MKKVALIKLLPVIIVMVISCGTDPSDENVNIQLQRVDNQPFVYIRPPEGPEGTPTETVTSVNEHAGRVYSYTKRIAYDNIIIVRDFREIEYYGYWWLNGKIRAYRETRTFEPFGESKEIRIDYCLYSNGYLNNYRAFIDGMLYYYGQEYDPDTLDYSGLPTVD